MCGSERCGGLYSRTASQCLARELEQSLHGEKEESGRKPHHKLSRKLRQAPRSTGAMPPLTLSSALLNGEVAKKDGQIVEKVRWSWA